MAAQQKTKKPGLFKRIGRFFAKSWSELKKVTWPTFKKVVSNTLIVLAVVLFFSLIVFGFDTGFMYLIKWIGSIGA
ncbi:MAG: preprotein translocase subunit SecE [Clostridia bacterium]|jgi:preprotein translocase subunit SecE|nr:preprotein translocase subunit SecE [Clostridia bacterium]MBQ2914323.1 preprotein translocase subunit SecE [Clostridia bacterium]MBQ4272351.1 preprotein translocase subunit SecE [Clostridia bacterium]MBR1954352.1 preprotein translocase subunit SecE [Clostridia bacterium]MBR2985142.1 preprotein translocase subunit SecE [Clostridia bacterium]